MKNMSARHYEMLLLVRSSENVSKLYTLSSFVVCSKCAPVVFDGLLAVTCYNDIILDLLFDFAVWHAYAKLRLHSDTTLSLFDESLRSLGFFLRLFKSKVCAEYPARELPTEDAARTRYSNSERRVREYNLNTYKIHSMGHYAPSIRELGTFENSSSQGVRVLLFSFVLCFSETIIIESG